VTKVRTKKTISIEKSFVPGKWLSSLSESIYSMLMIYLTRRCVCVISLIYGLGSDTFSFIPSWRLIIFLCFCRVVVVNDCRFDKIDGFYVTWLIT
jgi:hypothetical protein